MGVCCAMFGAEEAALKYFQMSYKVRKGLSAGEHDEIVSDSLFNMACVYAKLGMFSESIDCYEKCLKIRIETYGDDNLLVAKTYNDMAIVYARSKKYDRALICFKEQLDVLKLIEPSDSEKIASALHNTGNMHILGQTKNNDAAVKYYKESLRIYKILPGDHTSVITKIEERMKILDRFNLTAEEVIVKPNAN